jgi:hypothetical protein
MKVLASIATLTLLITASPSAFSEATPEDQAQAAALTWLGLVDAGDYQQSWVTAADYFRNSIEEREWVSRVSTVRASFRAPRSRSVSSHFRPPCPALRTGSTLSFGSRRASGIRLRQLKP